MVDVARGIFGKLLSKKTVPEIEEGPKIHPLAEEGVFQRDGHFGGPLNPSYIKFRGIFDMDGLYRVMVRWLKNRRFEFHETGYAYKPPDFTTIAWNADRKKGGYILERITVNWDHRGVNPEGVEVIKNGVKKRMDEGRLTIKLSGEVITAYEDIFGKKQWNSEVERRLRKFFDWYVIKKELELTSWDALYYEVYRLHEIIKKYLQFEANGSIY
ncbi:MAG: hypothetical protein GY861_14825 [bacterium]|nr:hypothetical protein [bacterium]